MRRASLLCIRTTFSGQFIQKHVVTMIDKKVKDTNISFFSSNAQTIATWSSEITATNSLLLLVQFYFHYYTLDEQKMCFNCARIWKRANLNENFIAECVNEWNWSYSHQKIQRKIDLFKRKTHDIDFQTFFILIKEFCD